MKKELYNGCHLHRAKACIEGGYPENAANWMERDYGELDDKWSWGKIDPASLEVVQNGILFLTFNRQKKKAAKALQNVGGDGI